MASAAGERYVGLISGTSMDGIDAVVVDFGADSPRLLAQAVLPFEGELRETLDEVRANPDGFSVAALGALDVRLGDRFAEAALAVVSAAGLSPSDITAIGSHGQTVIHHPQADPPFTLQVADAHRIARRTGIVTVADFRRADLAAGGQGAPLAPLLHDALFRSDDEARAVINLGGIANVTLLLPDQPLSGLDTGPANCFLDLWYRRNAGDGRYDAGGRWSAGGQVDKAWLAKLKADPYFARPAPKSTGIEYFSPAWLDARLPEWAEDRPADVQATLAELSAQTIADAIRTARPVGIDTCIVCGGGAANADLCRRLAAALDEIEITPSDRLGLPADDVESTLFAWLARERLAGRRLTTGPVTGANRPVLLGTVHEP